MTKNELKVLYSKCVDDDLEEDVVEELSAWELEEVFIPILDAMCEEGYSMEQMGSFTMACVLYHFMTMNTFYDLCERYNLDPVDNFEEFPENDKYWKKVTALKQGQSA